RAACAPNARAQLNRACSARPSYLACIALLVPPTMHSTPTGGSEVMAAPIIEADKLSKTYRVFQKKEGFLGAVRGLFRRQYKEVRAVDGVDFAIEPGDMVAFLGPNGAGKTTTLKMLSGLIYPSSGSARVLGFVPWDR